MEDMLYESDAAVRGAAFDGSAAGRILLTFGTCSPTGWGVVCSRRLPALDASIIAAPSIDEEPGGGAGSGDASDEEGQRVLVRFTSG